MISSLQHGGIWWLRMIHGQPIRYDSTEPLLRQQADLLFELGLFTGQVEALNFGVDQALVIHHVSHSAMGVSRSIVQHLDGAQTGHAGDLILQLSHLNGLKNSRGP